MKQSLFQRLLAVHLEWLILKGYTEADLNIPLTAHPTLATKLKQQLQEAISRDLWSGEPVHFSLDIKGAVPKDGKKVEFIFSYQYDPFAVKFNLLKMTAVLGVNQHFYPLIDKHPKSLPLARDAYRLLTQQSISTKTTKTSESPTVKASTLSKKQH